MVKFKLYFDTDKETEYLNSMAEQGYALTGYFAGFYIFDQCRPGEYIYQVDISEGLFRVKNDYREFMQEMGVEIVCLWGPWVILRKKAAEGPFVLYTDVESSIEYYQKIKGVFKLGMILEIICTAVEIICAAGGRDGGSVTVPLAMSSLLALLAVIFAREMVRVDGILAELRERIGQEPGKTYGRDHRPSRLMCLGLILNAAGFLIPGGAGSVLYRIIKGIVHGLALILIGAGVAVTLRGRRE